MPPWRSRAASKLAAALAEMIVGGVAERQHGKFHAAQIEAVALHHRFPERRGIVRRLAVAVGADHHQYAIRLSSTLGWQCAMSRTRAVRPAWRSVADNLFASVSELPVTVP